MIEFVARFISTTPLSLDVPPEYQGELAALAERYDDVRVKIAPPRKPRTTGRYSQNAHLNGHIQTICMKTGNDFQAVKEVVKMRAIGRGYPFTSYKGLVVPYSEADVSTVECAYLIDEVHQLAAEEGIALKEYDND